MKPCIKFSNTYLHIALVSKKSLNWCHVIHVIFNISLKYFLFPCFLKLIYQVQNDITNYWAVCNQSEFPKLLDRLITKKQLWDCRNIIINEQHGLRCGGYTTTNLLFYQYLMKNAFDFISADFSYAFVRLLIINFWCTNEMLWVVRKTFTYRLKIMVVSYRCGNGQSAHRED